MKTAAMILLLLCGCSPAPRDNRPWVTNRIEFSDGTNGYYIATLRFQVGDTVWQRDPDGLFEYKVNGAGEWLRTGRRKE